MTPKANDRGHDRRPTLTYLINPRSSSLSNIRWAASSGLWPWVSTTSSARVGGS